MEDGGFAELFCSRTIRDLLREMLKVIEENLKVYKKQTILLDEIRMFGDYREGVREEILDLVAKGVLKPIVSSGTDGNLKRPLYKKYRILAREDNTEQLKDEITKLHPRLLANGYLIKRPQQYVNHKVLIYKLNSYLCRGADRNMMSCKERSLVIFADEKMLELNESFIRALGLSEECLYYYKTPEQYFMDYIPQRKRKMILLICENKDIWFNIRRQMYEESKSVIFGIHIDGVLYGGGNEITGKGWLAAYYRYLFAEQVDFLYCGDIDIAGFDIFLRLQDEISPDGLNVTLFTPIYTKMLELCCIENLPDSEDNRKKNIEWERIYNLFSDEEIKSIQRIIALNKRLPQEIINYPILCENMR